MTGILIEFARWLADGVGWLPVLAAAVLKATVLLAGAGIASLALRRRSAAMRHFVWSVALFGCLLMPALMLVLPAWTVPVLPGPAAAIAVEPPAAYGMDDLATVPGPRPARPAVTPGPDPSPDSAPSSKPAQETGPVLSQLLSLLLPGAATLLAIWGAVALVLVGRLVAGHVRVRRMARRTTEAPAWEPLARALSEQVGLTRMPRFVEGTAAAMPMTWGLFRPVVMVPSVAAEWPETRLRAVLLHELAHVKRSDCLTQTIAGLVCAAYWFNPLSWIAAARLRAERERACDDSVLAAGADGGDYAEQLLDIARALRPAGLLSWATVSMARRSQLEGRLLAILDPDLPRRTPTRAAAVLAVLILVVLVPTLATVEAGVRAADAVAEGADAGTGAAAFQPGDDAVLSPSDAVRAATEAAIRSATAGQSAGLAAGAVDRAISGFNASGGSQRPMPAPTPTPTPTPMPRAGRAEEQREPVDQKILDALVAALDDTDDDVRHQALATLARLGDRRTTAPLVKALADESPDVREQAAMALARTRDPKAIDALTRALSDSASGVREHAAFALGQMRNAQAVEPLLKLVSDGNADVREQAVFALAQLRDRRATPALITALDDEDEDVREQSAFALSQLRDPEATPALMKLLDDPKASVREKAVFALGQIRDSASVEPLMGALKDESPDVRRNAAFALGQLRDPKAGDALTAALKDADADVRQAAALALSQVIGVRRR